MLKNNLAVRPPEVSTAVLQMPVETRGSRRELVKRQRRMQRIEGKTLVIGIDLARERQALTFGSGGGGIGRERGEGGPPDPGRGGGARAPGVGEGRGGGPGGGGGGGGRRC